MYFWVLSFRSKKWCGMQIPQHKHLVRGKPCIFASYFLGGKNHDLCHIMEFVMWNPDSASLLGFNSSCWILHDLGPKWCFIKFAHRDSNYLDMWICVVVSRNHVTPQSFANQTASLPKSLQTKPRHSPNLCKPNHVTPQIFANQTTSLPKSLQTKPHHSPNLCTPNFITPHDSPKHNQAISVPPREGQLQKKHCIFAKRLSPINRSKQQALQSILPLDQSRGFNKLVFLLNFKIKYYLSMIQAALTWRLWFDSSS